MALQIRRGPTADRMSYTPVVGELIWDTSTNSLYIGNGTTAGGLPAGTLVTEDVQDIASSMLVNGTHQNITFTYDDTLARINSTIDLSTFNGTLTADAFIGSHYASDSTLLLNALTGAVNLNGTVKGHIVPSTNIAYDLGSSSFRFRDLYLSGSSIILGNATITATGSAVNLPAGSTVNGITLGSGIESGMNYNINLVGDDSTLIVNARTKAINAASLTIGSAVNLPAGSTVDGAAFGFSVAAEDSTNIAVTNGSTLEIRGDQGIQTRLNSGVLYISANDVTAVKPSIRSDSTPAYIPFVGQTGSPSYIGTNIALRYIASTNTLETTNLSATQLDVSNIDAGVNISVIRTVYSATTSAFLLQQHHDTADAVNFTFYRTRGGRYTQTAVTNGDDLADISFIGNDGSGSIAGAGGAAISATVEGVVTTGNVPTKFTFSTNNGSALAARAELSAVGVWKVNTIQALTASTALSFGGMAKLATYADETAANAAVGGTPANGMMYYDTALSKIRGYQGGAWADLA